MPIASARRRQSITGEDRFGNAINCKTASSAKLRGEIAAIYKRLPAGSVVGTTKRARTCCSIPALCRPTRRRCTSVRCVAGTLGKAALVLC